MKVFYASILLAAIATESAFAISDSCHDGKAICIVTEDNVFGEGKEFGSEFTFNCYGKLSPLSCNEYLPTDARSPLNKCRKKAPDYNITDIKNVDVQYIDECSLF